MCISIKVTSYSDHHIAFEVQDNERYQPWFGCGVYGWAAQTSKHLTWRLMRSIRSSCDNPCLFFGDFNEILCQNEKAGGVMRSERDIHNFRHCIEECGLVDLGFQGSTYTWRRGNSSSTLIRERLDRFLASHDWCGIYSNPTVRHFPI